MALDITNDIKKTRLKNTILKKGFQGIDTKPEEIARFKWLNLDDSQEINTALDLYNFMVDHPFMLMLPSDESILPDMVSTLNGSIVFFSEYPKLSKKFEPILSEFSTGFIQKGLVYEYPLFQSTNVLIVKEQFLILYHLKSKDFVPEPDSKLILKFIQENPSASKKLIRDAFRQQPNIFSKIDYHLYQLQLGMQIYKTGFDQISGSQFSLLSSVLTEINSSGTNGHSLEDLLGDIIKSSLYTSPVLLQRALKKLADKQSIDAALKNLVEKGKLYQFKLNKTIHLAHKETFERTNILRP